MRSPARKKGVHRFPVGRATTFRGQYTHVKIHLSKACLRSKESGKMSNLLLQYALQLKSVLEDEEIP